MRKVPHYTPEKFHTDSRRFVNHAKVGQNSTTMLPERWNIDCSLDREQSSGSADGKLPSRTRASRNWHPGLISGRLRNPEPSPKSPSGQPIDTYLTFGGTYVQLKAIASRSHCRAFSLCR